MIKPKYEESIWRLCREINDIASTLPVGKRNMIANRLSRIQLLQSKINRKMDNEITNQSNEQIAARYTAKKAILQGMIDGRTISFLDSSEFKVSEMHTQMHCISRDIEEKKLPYILRKEWFEFAPGKRAKRYSIIHKES